MRMIRWSGKTASATPPPPCSATSLIDLLPEGYSTSSTIVVKTRPVYTLSLLRSLRFMFVDDVNDALRERNVYAGGPESVIDIFAKHRFDICALDEFVRPGDQS